MRFISEGKVKRFKEVLGDITEGLIVQEAMDNIINLREIYDCVVRGERVLDEIKERLMEENKILKKLLKLGDPGTFAVTFSILGERFDNSLCDSESSVNVMSFKTSRRLELSFIAPICTLKYAYGSSSRPRGFIPD